ncbi:MAG: nucleotide exchange factor GrpE [bacterium]|nr:nucleotide exchange factor GrpE [bacterium]
MRKSKAKGDEKNSAFGADPKERAEDFREANESGERSESSSAAETAEPSETDIAEADSLKQQVAELEDKLLRAAAEFDNFKKRTARQYEQMVASAGDRVLGDLLEIVDNFDRALAHSNGETDKEGLLEGMKLIGNQMKDLLKKHNVEPIEAIGAEFDPSLHEAMMQVNSDEYESGVVVMEIAKGYKRGDHVVRHSRVGVSSGPAQEEKNEPEEGSSK